MELLKTALTPSKTGKSPVVKHSESKFDMHEHPFNSYLLLHSRQPWRKGHHPIFQPFSLFLQLIFVASDLSDRTTACMSRLSGWAHGWIVSHAAPSTTSGIVGKREPRASIVTQGVDWRGGFVGCPLSSRRRRQFC